MSLLDRFWLSSRRVFIPVMSIALIFGFEAALSAAGFKNLVPSIFSQLPLSEQSLGWVLPVLATLVVAIIVDRIAGHKAIATA